MTVEETTTRCPNCGEELRGEFCSGCGQRELDLDRPFREIGSEAMEAFVDFDARILRTVWPLISLPGFLTVEFFEGRRKRYVHPFKLYFAFSVLLFVGLSLTGYLSVRVGDEAGETVREGRLVTIYSYDSDGENDNGDAAESLTDETPAPDAAPADSSADDEDEDSILGRFLNPFFEVLENDPDLLDRTFTDRLAKSIIVLVPVFALLLRMLYWEIPYIKQLVFSLHLHSFAFLVILVGVAIDAAAGVEQGQGWGNAGASTAILVYTFMALRRVYGQGRLWTALKMLLLLLGYLVALIATMILTLVLTVITISASG